MEFNEEIPRLMVEQPENANSFTPPQELPAPQASELFHHSPKSNDNAAPNLTVTGDGHGRGQATDSHRLEVAMIENIGPHTRREEMRRPLEEPHPLRRERRRLLEERRKRRRRFLRLVELRRRLEDYHGWNKDDETVPIVESSGTESSYRIDIGVDNSIGYHTPHGRTNTVWSSQKVDLEKIFVITNFVLEILSTALDQLSSLHKPQCALLGMLMSFLAIIMCIAEIVYKIQKNKVTWRWRSTIPWLYYPSQDQKPFGNFKDMVGLVCALSQCIVTTITFAFVHRRADNPIKVSVWPVVFAFGLLCSKFLEKPEGRNV